MIRFCTCSILADTEIKEYLVYKKPAWREDGMRYCINCKYFEDIDNERDTEEDTMSTDWT